MQLHLAHEPHLGTLGGALHPLAPLDAALLAWLALEGPTSRTRVAALLWPDKDADAARNSLRQRLFQLRKSLGVEVVVGSATLALAEGVTHDLEDADSVLGQAAGEDIAAGEFAQWLERQRTWRRGRLRSSLAELADMAEQARDWDDALTHARELLALEPLSEAAHRRLMRLHYLRGDRAAALLAFDDCEQVLKNEVGATPDMQTLALLRQIERSELAEPGAGAVMPAVLQRPPRLVGRKQAWSRLGQAWHAGSPVLLRGEGGMGKSRLLADFTQAHRADAAGAGIVMVGARPGDRERPLGLVSRVLRAVVAVPGCVLAPGVQRELARLLPELGEPTPDGAGAQARLVNAVETALQAARDAGLLAIAVDDLHWADSDSLHLLETVAGGDSQRWLLAMRPGEGGQPAETFQADWLSSSRASVIDLQPLSVDEVAELLDLLSSAGAATHTTASDLHHRSGGNPMFVLECLKAAWTASADHGGPPTPMPGSQLVAVPAMPAVPIVQRQIAQRLLRFSPMAVRLLRCAAVAGQDFSAGLAATVLQVRLLDLADAWNELEAAQVLSEGVFAHDLVFEAALGSVPEPIARELHREIAQALHAAGAAPDRLAWHWLSAGDEAMAVEPLLRAAHAEKAAMRAAQAERWYAQAADILERQGRHSAAYDALFQAAEAQSYIGVQYDVYVDRIAALARTDEQALFADVLRCANLLNEGRIAQVEALATQGLARARLAGCAEAESEFEWSLFHIAWTRGDAAQAVAHGERDLALRRQLPAQGTRMDQRHGMGVLLGSLALATTNSGRLLDGRARHEEALDYQVKFRLTFQQALCAANFMSVELALGRLAAAQALGERIDTLLDEGLVHDHDRLHALGAMGVLHGLSGQWGAALRRFDELEQAIDSKPSGFAPTLPVMRAHFLLAIGRRDLALQVLDRMALKLPGGPSLFRVVTEVYRCIAAQQRDGVALLEPISAIGNVLIRLRSLLALAPQLDAATVLPVLTLASAQARDGGGWGFWIALQARRASAMARLGQVENAAALAREAWARHLGGVWPMLYLPDFAADLAEALRTVDPGLATEVAQRGRDALGAAGATLDSHWRETCLSRSPLHLRLAALQPQLASAPSTSRRVRSAKRISQRDVGLKPH